MSLSANGIRLLFFLILVAAGCWRPPVSGTSAPRADRLTLLESGPYAVGFDVMFERDSNRLSLPDTTAGGGRPMQIAVWYPARTATSSSVTLRAYVELGAGTLGSSYITPAATAARVDAFARAPIAHGVPRARLDSVLDWRMLASRRASPAKGRFPLVVFLHSTFWGASAMSEDLASHGFVVAAVESKGAREPAYRLSRENLDAMVRDAGFIVERLRREPNVDSHLGIIGMSNGSIAAMALELSGVVPAAVVSLDGGIGERAGGIYLGERSNGTPSRFHVPVLHLYSPDNSFLDFQYLRSYESAPRMLVRVGHLRHADFLTNGALERVMPGAFGPAPAEASVGFETVARYTRSFLTWHLTGDSTALRFLEASPETNGVPAGLLAIERLPAR